MVHKPFNNLIVDMRNVDNIVVLNERSATIWTIKICPFDKLSCFNFIHTLNLHNWNYLMRFYLLYHCSGSQLYHLIMIETVYFEIIASYRCRLNSINNELQR